MLKDIMGIEVQGANFTELKPLDFMKKNDERKSISIIYGRNGTGKSTISRAFNFIKGNEEESIVEVKLRDIDGKQMELSSKDKETIYVFNEDYIDEKIKFQTDGIHTIVLLGKKKELTEKIERRKKQLEEKQKEFSVEKSNVEKYEDKENEISPQYYLEAMKKALKGENNWSGRDSKINDKRVTTPVKDGTYEKFVNRAQPEQSRDELILKYTDKMQEYLQAREGKNAITEVVKTKIGRGFDEEKCVELLGLKIEKPELSEREKYILQLTATRGRDYLYDVRNFFESEEQQCPFCFQRVEKEYKKDVVSNIEHILSKAAKKHQNELDAMKMEEIDISLEAFRTLNSELVDEIYLKFDELNQSIKVINQTIDSKINKVYIPVSMDRVDFMPKVIETEKMLEQLEKLRLNYNATVEDVKGKRDELVEINADIAYWDIRGLFAKYQKYLGEEEKAKKRYKTVEDEVHNLEKILGDLNAERESVFIAYEKINAGLRYIFYSDNRLSLEVKDNQYYLLSRGKPVKPTQISTGERNALALTYFFVDILSNKEEENAYKSPYFLVVDDPISSIDVENRVGLLSYLQLQIKRILKNNEDSSILILTHDALTEKEIESFFDKKKFVAYELDNEGLKDISAKGTYTDLICNIYKYALGENSACDDYIGNAMRRMIEAFSTFSYKVGIDQLPDVDAVVKLLPQKCIEYYKTLLYRLVLNGESHTRDRVKEMDDPFLYPIYSPDERKRMAKDVLCLMYCINEGHVLCHLKKAGRDQNEVRAKLDSWCRNIEESVR